MTATMLAQPIYFVVPSTAQCLDPQHFIAYGASLAAQASPVMYGQIYGFPTLVTGSAAPTSPPHKEGPSAETLTKTAATHFSEKAEPRKALESDSKTLWMMAKDKDGSRELQRMIDVSTSDKERSAIAGAMRGHVWAAICCPNANHVLQKIVVTMRPRDSAFILDELTEGSHVTKATQHKYGCRVIQRLIEHCSTSQLDTLVEALMPETVLLSRHSYGNYVIKALLQYGSCAQQHMIVKSIGSSLAQLGSGNYSCGVLHEALTTLPADERLAFVRAMVQEPGLFVRMSRSRQGHFVVRAAFEELLSLGDPADLAAARQELFANIDTLRETRYGRIILSLFGNSTPDSRCESGEGDDDSIAESSETP